jgi:hypothetical protein
MRIRDGKNRIRDPWWKKFASGIKIPDPHTGVQNRKITSPEKNSSAVWPTVRMFLGLPDPDP